MTKRWTKREIRQEARRFAATLLFSQDQPDWCEEAGVPQDLAPIFMDELTRVAERIRATIKDGKPA